MRHLLMVAELVAFAFLRKEKADNGLLNAAFARNGEKKGKYNLTRRSLRTGPYGTRSANVGT